jgi:hypothetical protein
MVLLSVTSVVNLLWPALVIHLVTIKKGGGIIPLFLTSAQDEDEWSDSRPRLCG